MSYNQSRRHVGGLLRVKSPQTKLQAPLNWDMKHYKWVEFLSIFGMSSPPTAQTQSPLLKTFWPRFWLWCYEVHPDILAMGWNAWMEWLKRCLPTSVRASQFQVWFYFGFRGPQQHWAIRMTYVGQERTTGFHGWWRNTLFYKLFQQNRLINDMLRRKHLMRNILFYKLFQQNLLINDMLRRKHLMICWCQGFDATLERLIL